MELRNDSRQKENKTSHRSKYRVASAVLERSAVLLIMKFMSRFLFVISTQIRLGQSFQRHSALTGAVASKLSMSSTTQYQKFEKPSQRIIHENDIPTLYVYDHCPFCVRVRAAFGLKNIKHNLFFLANDDVATPTQLVGKKISPIFEWKTDNICMPESMDIINVVDSDTRMGPTNIIQPASGRDDLKAWQDSVRDLLRGLQRPRYVATGLLPEFQQVDGRNAFIKNHEMVGYTKDEWKKGTMTLEEKIQIYQTAFEKDPAADIEELNRKLIELDDILYCEYYATEACGGISLDDIDLFARLRSITIVKNVAWPTKLRNYMDYMADLTDIPLYDAMAM
jgi:glutaredoxin 2